MKYVLFSLFVDLKIIENLSVHMKIKKGVTQQRHDATKNNKSSKNIFCVCKQKYETVCNCVKCNYGCCCSGDYRYQQLTEYEKIRDLPTTRHSLQNFGTSQ